MTVVQLPLRDAQGVTEHARTKLRITRRGRAVFALLVTLLVLGVVAFGVLVGSAQAQASSDASGQEFGYVVVQPGDSLWQIATSLDQQSDPRDTISEIVRLNQLSGSDVEIGQELAVPLRLSAAPGVEPR